MIFVTKFEPWMEQEERTKIVYQTTNKDRVEEGIELKKYRDILIMSKKVEHRRRRYFVSDNQQR